MGQSAYQRLGVIGAGAWGTALAAVAAKGQTAVKLWAMEEDVVHSIRQSRENARYLPGIFLPPEIAATSDLAEASQADVLLVVVPAQHLRNALGNLAPLVNETTPIVLCAKGIERGSGRLLTEVLAEEMPGSPPAILSGPSFARDVAQGLPTAVTIAAELQIAARLQATLGQANFRPYASEDLTGVALGGAAKNVYAIGCGIVTGMKLGESARAAFLARSFAELCRLGEALGGQRATLTGLSGLGDLVLTATSPSSRNYSFGLAFGTGHSRTELMKPGHALAEGVETAPALAARGQAQGVELPIAETIAALLDGSLALADAVPRLMGRPLGNE